MHKKMHIIHSQINTVLNSKNNMQWRCVPLYNVLFGTTTASTTWIPPYFKKEIRIDLLSFHKYSSHEVLTMCLCHSASATEYNKRHFIVPWGRGIVFLSRIKTINVTIKREDNTHHGDHMNKTSQYEGVLVRFLLYTDSAWYKDTHTVCKSSSLNSIIF